MKPHVLNALNEGLVRRRELNIAIDPKATAPDYDHLFLHRGVLRTPEGGIPVKRIGKGSFAEVYQETDIFKNPVGRVFALVEDENYDKDIAVETYDGTNPHLPKVERYGATRDRKVFVMPEYKTPLKKADDPVGWKDFKALESCRWDAWRQSCAKDFRNCGYPMNVETIECAEKAGVRPAVVEALEQLKSTAANYSQDYMFEFSPRNLATDERGNLVLLDVLYDVEALNRKRAAERKKRGL